MANLSATRRLPRWARRTLRTLAWSAGSLLVLLLLTTAIASWYISRNKVALLKQITQQVSEDVNGTLIIKDVEPSFFADFPYTSLVLKGVSLHDSMYDAHHHNLVEAANVFVRVNPIKLISKKLDISRLTISHGSVYLFTDSLGYSNNYLLQGKPKKDTPGKKKSTYAVRAVVLEDMEVTYLHAAKFKDFRLHINKAITSSKQNGAVWTTNLNLDAAVAGIAFNVTRGSFLNKARLVGPLKLVWNSAKKTMEVTATPLEIDGLPVDIAGNFSFIDSPSTFSLHISCNKLVYKTAMNWVSQNVSGKLSAFDFKNTISATADVSGHMQYHDTPIVLVNYVVKDNEFSTPAGTFTECGFSGSYSNQYIPGGSHNDPNSAVRLMAFKGKFEGIPVGIDSAIVSNLVYPLLDCRVRSAFSLPILNDLDNMPFSFAGGTANAVLHYRGGLRSDDTLSPQLDGQVTLSNAAFTYLPRGIPVTNVQALLQLTGDDLFLRNISMNTPGGPLKVEGSAAHFFSLYFSQPGKMQIAFNASSPSLDLTMLRAFAGKRSAVVAKKPTTSKAKGNAVRNAAAQLDNVLQQCSAQITASFGNLRYGGFLATAVKVDAALTEGDLRLNNVSLRQGDGSMVLKGSIGQGAAINPFSLDADITGVVVDDLFRATKNFGQQAIEADNLRGRLTAHTSIRGQMGSGGSIVPKSLAGKASFVLQGGALLNFEPMMKISKYAFKKRGLENITFERIEDVLEFDRGRIVINPLHIESSAFNMLVAGVYGPPNGTDIAITLPLGNPSAGSQRWRKKGKVGPGITLNLRATDGPDGKVKIGWDPRKKSAGQSDTTAGEEARVVE